VSIGSVQIGERDRRALLLLGLALAVVLILRFGVYGESAPAVVAAPDQTALYERRLQTARRTAAGVPEREAALKAARQELAEREKGLIQGATGAQAQARMMQVVRAVGKTEGIDVRGAEIGEVKAFGENYGTALLAITFECRIEQLVNFLAALGREAEAISTNDIRITLANPKEKTISVRLGLAGLVPKQLAPARKGGASF
jgi:hypothetical protein